MMKREWIKRLFAVALSLAVAVTFVPLLGDIAFAEDSNETGIENNVASDNNNEAEESESINSPEQVLPDVDVEIPESDGINIPDAATDNPDDAALDQSDNAEASNAIESDGEQLLPTLSGNDAEFKAKDSNSVYTLTVTRRGNNLVLNGSFVGSYKYNSTTYTKAKMVFGEVFADGNPVGTCNFKNSLSNVVIPLSSVGGTGYHSVNINVYGVNSNGSRTGLWSTNDIYYRVGIFAAPSSNGSFQVYHNYMDYMSPVDPNLINYRLFVEYNGVVYGPMSYLQSVQMTGLVPNTDYGVISYYGVYKNGSWFTGKEEGYYRNCGVYRTGSPNLPKIKSIKVKAYKVKKKTQRVYGYYTGLYLGKTKYYSYKLKIIVKLKKKPGTNGIWINGKKYKGNKKKYTVKLGSFTSYYKPKGKKYTVAIYTYFNDSYGGYSPLYTKVKKIK